MTNVSERATRIIWTSNIQDQRCYHLNTKPSLISIDCLLHVFFPLVVNSKSSAFFVPQTRAFLGSKAGA
jgi:hypothetical protein